jgi:uncharacterized protein YaeQ
MALRASVYKADLTVSDLDRGHYGTHALTIARHPSETEERMMIRLLAWALNADEALEFGRGLSAEDEPDLVLRDLTGSVQLSVLVGLPDEKWVRKAAGRSARVVVIAYGGHKARQWWDDQGPALARHANLVVLSIPPEAGAELAAMAARQMQVSITVQEGQIWADAGDRSVSFEPVVLKGDLTT